MHLSRRTLTDTELANLEYWKSTALFRATQTIFGDIDHLIRADNDLIARAWIVAVNPNRFSIQLGLGDTVAAPLVRNDLRDDVARAFPAISGSQNAGLIFVLEDCAAAVYPYQLFWRVSHDGQAYQDISIEHKELIDACDL